MKADGERLACRRVRGEDEREGRGAEQGQEFGGLLGGEVKEDVCTGGRGEEGADKKGNRGERGELGRASASGRKGVDGTFRLLGWHAPWRNVCGLHHAEITVCPSLS